MIRHLLSTLAHKGWVAIYLLGFAGRLLWRALVHDLSKLREPERSRFAAVLPELAGTTYGSDRYQELLEELGPALEHHYRANSHHPEHHPAGVAGMDLEDLVEMFCDWRAAVRRHDDGDLLQSVNHNAERFSIDGPLDLILWTTARELDR